MAQVLVGLANQKVLSGPRECLMGLQLGVEKVQELRDVYGCTPSMFETMECKQKTVSQSTTVKDVNNNVR